MLRSLNNKIIFSIILVTLLGAFLTAFTVILTVQYQLSQKYTVEKQATIESLSLSLSEDMFSRDYEQVERTVKSALVYENIASLTVFDQNGNVVNSLSEFNDNIDLELSKHTLSMDGKAVGAFEVGFSDRYIDDLIQRTVIVLSIVVVGFLILIGLAFFIFMRYSVLQPIRTFSSAVNRIDMDNLSTRIRINSQDEIGLLATAFNDMAENLEKSQADLKQSYDELEEKVELRTRGERRRAEQLRTINEVGRRISMFLSLDELLPYVVNSLRDTFHYYNVNIFLVKDTGSVELSAGTGGYEKEIPTGFSITFGQGIVGTAAQNEEFVVVADVSTDSRYIASEELPNTCSELSVPIKLGTEILGVLDIQSDEINAFDEIDIFTVQTIGDQLAVAIQNARYYLETRELAIITERNRLAREIHDTLAQGFTGIILQLEAAEQTLGEDNSSSQEHLDTAKRLAKESLNEARRSVWALRPQLLENLTFIDALRTEAESFGNENNVKVDFYTTFKERNINPDAENALLRIFQEALNNIRKHARANNVEVRFTRYESNFVLIINDDGIGFDSTEDKSSGFGLISMRERVKLLGGSLEISSEKDRGTRLLVKIPVREGA
ncbi:MAG TPA: GAF domain-containing protein [Dehalococcoidia bacterium]|nr:GAF domain-containing protein [Dehalococcoidia bacterium]